MTIGTCIILAEANNFIYKFVSLYTNKLPMLTQQNIIYYAVPDF